MKLVAHRFVQEGLVGAKRLEILDRRAGAPGGPHRFTSPVDQCQIEEVGEAIRGDPYEGDLDHTSDTVDLYDPIEQARIKIDQSVVAESVDLDVRLMGCDEHPMEGCLGATRTCDGGDERCKPAGDGALCAISGNCATK